MSIDDINARLRGPPLPFSDLLGLALEVVAAPPRGSPMVYEVLEVDVSPANRTLDVLGAYYQRPAALVRTRFTRTLHGAGASHLRGEATVAMRAIDARNVDAFDALDDAIFAAGGHVAIPWRTE